MVTKELYWNYFTSEVKDTILQIMQRMGWSYEVKEHLVTVNMPIDDIDFFEFIFDSYL